MNLKSVSMESQNRSSSKSVSVIIPVTERVDNATDLHRDYSAALDRLNIEYELIYVLDGPFQNFREQLCRLRDDGHILTIVQLGKHFGESAALEAGLENSRGDWLLTLPAFYQIDPAQLDRLFQEIDDWDMLIGRRHPRIDSKINQWLSNVFHSLVNWMTSSNFHDLSSGVRLIRRDVLVDLPLYGDLHRFLPVLASRKGYRVTEKDLAQSSKESYRRLPPLGVYPRRLLDLLAVFFLIKFTKKPLRFFGLIGAGIASIGGLWTIILVIQRLLFDQALAQRPGLLLATLLIVLGVQIFALGLIGEIVIYTHAREIREYTIEEIIN